MHGVFACDLFIFVFPFASPRIKQFIGFCFVLLEFKCNDLRFWFKKAHDLSGEIVGVDISCNEVA